MIKIKEAIVVEGKYDKIKLSSIFDTIIIKTDGFHIYKDKKTIDLLKNLADTRGVIVLTDSDNSGLMIRNYLKNVLSDKNVKHVFTKTQKGKEKRKKTPSKAGLLGVEGIDSDELKNIILSCARLENEENEQVNKKEKITKTDLFKLGISGGENSSIIRKKILKELSLPENMSQNMMLDVLNCFYDKDFLEKIILKIKDI